MMMLMLKRMRYCFLYVMHILHIMLVSKIGGTLLLHLNKYRSIQTNFLNFVMVNSMVNLLYQKLINFTALEKHCCTTL